MKDELSDNFIRLRRYRVADVPLLFAAVRESIKEISRWMEWCHPAYSIEESSTWVLSRDEAWASGAEYGFVITDAQTGMLLGGVGLNFLRRENQSANLGYWVRTSQAGRGVASAATILTARFGFEELGLTRIEIVAAVGNLASQRVAEKVGATREGVLRNRLIINGQPHDAVMFSLVPQDVNL